MDKKKLTERDICTKFINPALEKAGWNMLSQVREEVSFSAGRIVQKVDELMALCDQLKKRLNYASEIRCQLAEAVVKGALN